MVSKQFAETDRYGAGVEKAGVRAWPEVRRTLPKARLITLRRSHARKWFFASSRLANAWSVYCGPLLLIVRAPWLEKSARALYPNRFADVDAPDPLAGWDGTICPPHELPPGTPPVVRELCKRANEWNAEGDFSGEVLSLLANCRAALNRKALPTPGGSDETL